MWLSSSSASSLGESLSIRLDASVRRASQVSKGLLVIGERGEQLGLVLLLQRHDDGVQVTGNDFVELVKGEIDPMIRHPPLGKVVRTDPFGPVAINGSRGRA